MDPIRAQQENRRASARYQFISDEEQLTEDDFDDVWPTQTPGSARRYQGSADAGAGTRPSADVRTQQRSHRPVQPGRGKNPVPARRTSGTQEHLPVPTSHRAIPLANQVKDTDEYYPSKDHILRRFHWLVLAGIALMIMILGWICLSAVGNWWQTTSDDLHYGRPRTFQIDAVVGHNDSPQHPSHFVVVNLNRHIMIIEIPGGDVSKSVIFSGPTLLGANQDLTPATLSFQDVNHDQKPDMILNVQGSQFLFINEKGTFVPAPQNQTTPT